MNKQEIIDELEYNQHPLASSQEEIEWNNALDLAVDIIKEELDEPEKPVIPQYVAEWYEDNREALEEYVFTNIRVVLPVIPAENPMYKWLDGKGIGVIVDCIRNGYEVEKEKLYTVKFANEDFGEIYIGIFKKVNKLGISSLPLNDDEVKSWFTEDELKKLKFWKNSAFEIEEVEA